MHRLTRRSRRQAIELCISEALGEPRSIANQLARAALNHEALFWDDYAEVLTTAVPAARWREPELVGPMFYQSYAELAHSGQPIVALLAHMGCYVSGLYFLHRFSPTDRPLSAFRRADGLAQTARLFERVVNVGPQVALLDDSAGAAVRAYRTLRDGGVLYAFADVPVIPTATRQQPVELFGAPAVLPDGALRLALTTGAMVIFIWVTSDGEKLRVSLSEPFDPGVTEQTGPPLAGAIGWLAERLEHAVCAAPAQWLNWLALGEMWRQGALLCATEPTSSL